MVWNLPFTLHEACPEECPFAAELADANLQLGSEECPVYTVSGHPKYL